MPSTAAVRVFRDPSRIQTRRVFHCPKSKKSFNKQPKQFPPKRGKLESIPSQRVGGRLQSCYATWEQLTKKPMGPPNHNGTPHKIFKYTTRQFLSNRSKGVSRAPELGGWANSERGCKKIHNSSGFFSPIFVVPKKDGGCCPVINLRRLNSFILVQHFKMESIFNLSGTLRKGDYMVKLDLKDTYLTVPIHSEHKWFLRFTCQGKHFQFRTLPFGLAKAPRVFTILLKPVASTLRASGICLILTIPWSWAAPPQRHQKMFRWQSSY